MHKYRFLILAYLFFSLSGLGKVWGQCWKYIDNGAVSGVVIIEFFSDCTWNAPQGLLEFEVLAIGGGGGGGFHSGGGGGSGGATHGKIDISKVSVFGLLADTPFDIVIGKGGNITLRNLQAEDGKNSIFNSTGTHYSAAGGVYQLIAGGGGGGGSDSGSGGNPGGMGRAGKLSSRSDETNMTQLYMFHGSGGGASHPTNIGGIGPNRNGGNGSTHSGGGGGGIIQVGFNGNTSEQGGAGGAGRRFSLFDINLKRYFCGGGGGGSDFVDFQAPGGSGVGGMGGAKVGHGALGNTPGSGGGGGGHSIDEQGGRGADGVVFVKYEIARILPVENLYFKAEHNSFTRSGDLTWATAKEGGNSHFEIERSVNETRNWTKVGEASGQEYSDVPVEYRYIDQNLPAAGGNIFYRVRQVDFDGSFSYSLTRAIQVEPLDGNTSWIAYPNPSAFRSSITVDLLDRSGYTDESILIRISNSREIFESYSASNPDEVSAIINSYLDQANPGIHILQLIWENKSEQLKLIRN